MVRFSKECLETLKERLDLVEVLMPYVDLKKAGAAFKGCCPFHDEKTPSFIIKRGDSHYHCFGCGAHGDAIAFLMDFLKLSFSEAVESLAEKFHIVLQYEEEVENSVSTVKLKEVLDFASDFFMCILLHTEEGIQPLNYLFARGFTLDFIRRFQLGWAPRDESLFFKVMHEKKIDKRLLLEAGLQHTESKRSFFRERITFPIRNPMGSVIGFSARKIEEKIFGGKYINSAETALFKKSKILFGLDCCRRRITMERKCILVEGQIDCLKMIDEGFDFTVAALGTAFGGSHIDELVKLGIQEAILLFDGDEAGKNAASKAGDLFQKVGIAVKVVTLPQGLDPDLFLKRFGKDGMQNLLEKSEEYLSFQMNFISKDYDISIPAGKSAWVGELQRQIREWEQPIMVHESLKKLALLANIPFSLLGIPEHPPISPVIPSLKPKTKLSVDPHRVLELDLLRWLILMGEEKPEILIFAKQHLNPSLFWVPICRSLFEAICMLSDDKVKLTSFELLSYIEEKDGIDCFEEIYNKKINREKAYEKVKETVQKILDRQWLHTREEIKMKIHSGNLSSEEVLESIKEFDALKKPQLER